MKTKFFVDFDGTIFNTVAFRDKMFEIFVMAGFDEDEIKNTYIAESLDFLYSANGHLDRLYKIHPFDIEKAKQRMDKLINKSSEFLFDDSIQFLKEIDREKYLFNLISLGDIQFQRAKAKCSGVEPYFDNVYYCEVQKWEYLDKIVERNEKFIIADDRPDVLEKIAKKFTRSFPLFVDRAQKDLDDPSLLSQPSFSGISVKNMKQAGQYL